MLLYNVSMFNQTENKAVDGKSESESRHFGARKPRACDLFPLRACWTQKQNCDGIYIKLIKVYIHIYIYRV